MADEVETKLDVYNKRLDALDIHEPSNKVRRCVVNTRYCLRHQNGALTDAQEQYLRDCEVLSIRFRLLQGETVTVDEWEMIF